MENVAEYLKKFEKINVLIIGDVMVDRYLTGKVTRISPEAPVPVVLMDRSENRLGGAGNVALNIKALGATPFLCSVIGKDEAGTHFLDLLPQNSISPQGILRSVERKTTVKTRVLAGNQQLLRVDSENTNDLSENELNDFLDTIRQLLNSHVIHIAILQDYNKGVLSEKAISTILQELKNREIPVAVDPKKNNFANYKGVSLFKPNLKEIRDCVPFEVEAQTDSLHKASEYIRGILHHQYTLITLSEKGIFYDDDTIWATIPTVPRSIADVSGAGDTVISVASLGLASGMEIKDTAFISNLAGGQVCEKAGVVPVDKEQLLREIKAKSW